jgi:hypothetical protein
LLRIYSGRTKKQRKRDETDRAKSVLQAEWRLLLFVKLNFLTEQLRVTRVLVQKRNHRG